jgi:hypothetical protein
VDFARDSFAIAHLLDKGEQLRDNGSDATTSCNEYDVIEGFNAPLHTSIWTINKGTICVPWAMVESVLKNLLCETTERAEDENHIPVSLAIFRWKVFTA